MNSRRTARRRAIMRRRIFFGGCFLVLALLIALIVFVVKSLISNPEKTDGASSVVSTTVSSEIESEKTEVSSETESQITTSSEMQESNVTSSQVVSGVESTSSKAVSSKEVSSQVSSSQASVSSKPVSSAIASSEEPVSSVEQSQTESVSQKYTLDENYTNLLLVNGTNPLPETYDYEGELVKVDTKYINGSLRQVNKNIEPYLISMIEAAWADGVKLYIRSPYRSYSTQKMLYENQVKRCLDKGLAQAEAEDEAATVVARPGTSEHHTGLAIDFNIADDSFESMPAYKWLLENAAEYGFVMRYSKEKQPITGVIYESWHWRFVGINVAKEMNTLGMCLEEYVEYKKQG